MTVASSGHVNGTMTVAATIPLPSAGGGCSVNTSKLVFDSHGTFTGAVAGANVGRRLADLRLVVAELDHDELWAAPVDNLADASGSDRFGTTARSRSDNC